MLKRAETQIFRLCNGIAKDFRSIGDFIGFSEDFKLIVEYVPQTPIMTEQEKVNAAKAKIDAGLTTRRRELEKFNPNLGDKEIDALLKEIEDEKISQVVDLSGE